MIDFCKSGLNEQNLALIKKLEKHFPIGSLLVDLENKYLSLLEVKYDSKLYGLLIVRGEFNRKNELVLVCQHVIAVDGLELHFSNLLEQSFPDWLLSKGFSKIRLETDKSGLYIMARKFLGEPKIYVFEKGLNELIIDRKKTPAFNN